MTLTEQVLHDKIKANKAQYDLDREVAKISVLSSGGLENYEYLTGEYLGYKPDVKPEGLLKRLKNTEDKKKNQLNAIKDQGERQLEAISSYSATNKPRRIEFGNKNNQEARKLVDEIKRINRENKNKKFVCFHSKGTPYDSNKFSDINQFGNDILYSNTSIKQAKDEQDEIK